MKSLRRGLMLRLLSGGALLLVAASIFLEWRVKHVLLREFDSALLATARSLSAQGEEKHGQLSVDFGEVLPQFSDQNSNSVFVLFSQDSRELQHSPSLGTASLPFPMEKLIGQPSFYEVSPSRDRVFRCVALRVFSQDEDEEGKQPKTRREAILVTGQNRVPLDHTLALLQWSLLLVGTGALIGLGGVVHWSIRTGLQPVTQLRDQVAAVDAGCLDTRFAKKELPEELQPVALALNQLLGRLEAAFARETRFTATAAHEFRTPLAELRALAEVSLTTPGTEAEREEAWRDALTVTLHMEALARRLLQLTRTENPSSCLEKRPVDLVPSIALAWRAGETVAQKRGVELYCSVPPGLSLETDATLLGVVLENLIRNAVEHGVAKTPLTITHRIETESITLCFQNRATLAEADLPYLFERFWRKDTVRTGGQHHGLGLALAAEFTQLLGGELTVRLTDGSAVEFFLRLPVRLDLHPPEIR
jgi:two-component system sensor histidine kinase QseC